MKGATSATAEAMRDSPAAEIVRAAASLPSW